MNTVVRTVNGLWSLLCTLVTVSLFGVAIYWVFLQAPMLRIDTQRSQTVYTVTSGSVVYLENPVTPPDTVAQVVYDGKLKGVAGNPRVYVLNDIGSVEPTKVDQTLATPKAVRPATPLYSLFVPSYVAPGRYEYRMRATYKLNPFKSETLELPPIQIIVE